MFLILDRPTQESKIVIRDIKVLMLLMELPSCGPGIFDSVYYVIVLETFSIFEHYTDWSLGGDRTESVTVEDESTPDCFQMTHGVLKQRTASHGTVTSFIACNPGA
jgi:hypothetical protein